MVPFPKIPVFYALPKLHKRVMPPSGRPIVAGIGNSSEKASILIDDYLRLHVTSLPSYLGDTVQVLRAPDGLDVLPDAILVMVDIEALYLSIPHKLGLSVVSHFLMERGTSAYQMNSFIIRLLNHVLNNIFNIKYGFFYSKARCC